MSHVRSRSTDDSSTLSLGTRGEDTGASAGLVLRVMSETTFSSTRLPREGAVVIGRGEGVDVPIDDPSISRRHARVHVGPGLRIEDLGSENGTRVRGTSLAPGECVAIALGEPVDLGAVLAIVQPLASAPMRDRTARVGIAMQELHRIVDRVARGTISVLVLGETGVGKEVLAEEIHRRSPRAAKPFLRLNCTMFSEALLESELFGHERGAFTGALLAKPGLLETAAGGTVFIDEVGELPGPLQVKLLRVLEDRAVRRVGALSSQTLDVRFIAATNRDLDADAAAGRFRQDLLFRLAGVALVVPPLRERLDEIAPLARTFIEEAAHRAMRSRAPELSDAALAALTAWSWPGNVRELRNVIERAVLLAGPVITREHLPFDRPPTRTTSWPPARLPEASQPGAEAQADEQLERQRVLEALARCGGNQTHAAKLLGLARGTLAARLDAYGITRPRKKPRSIG